MKAENDWEIPEPLVVCEVGNDLRAPTVIRRHGNAEARTRLVLSHGNGLAIDLYLPFWSLLAEEFDLFLYDLRNHGWNPVGPRREHNIPTLIRDHDLVLETIDRRFGAKPTVGVYHSVTTLVSLLADSRKYAALVLFDPPLLKPAVGKTEWYEATEKAIATIRRRGNRFQSEEEFAELLGFLPGFVKIPGDVRKLMARTTLRRTADGQAVELRCPREYEAEIMEASRKFSPLLDLSILSCPTKVIGADPSARYSYLPTFDLSHVEGLDYDFVPDTTHLLQLEQPAQCAALLREFLANQGL